MTECPYCGSTRIWKAGFYTLKNGIKVQRLRCAFSCGKRFSESRLKLPKSGREAPTQNRETEVGLGVTPSPLLSVTEND